LRSLAKITKALSLGCLAAICAMSSAQDVDVSARVELTRQSARSHAAPVSLANVVVWLTPLQKNAPIEQHKQQQYTLAQKDKQFVPHLLVVPTGSSVDFPNLDPFYHNVFSLFNGKRFDLGLYEAHTRRSVQFDREGVSYIFCNIHPEMGAVVVSLSTPYYAVSSHDGAVTLHNVPPGSYRLNVWAENVSIDRLNELSRTVEITLQNTQLGTLHLQMSGDVMSHHTNKFGEAYPPASKDPY
jgi:plastocyanin